MRIGVDLRPFLRRETGVGVYLRNLLWSLAAFDETNEYFLFSSSWKDRFPEERLPRFKRMRFRDLKLPVRAVNFFWYRLGWPPLDSFFRSRLDLTHSPVPLPLPTRGNKIVTVCDLFFLDTPDGADRQAREEFLPRAAKAVENADGVIAISRFTREAVLDRFAVGEDRVKAIHLGVNPAFREKPAAGELEAVRKKYRLPGRFLLFVGALEPRKNLRKLLDTLIILHEQGEGERIPLVIVGREGGDSEAVTKRINELGLEERVRRLGYVPEVELRALFSLAEAFVFPSLCEGFGLPILEAMACGLPVAASKVGAIPEVAGDAALLFNPDDAADMAEKILKLLNDSGLRGQLVARGKKRAKAFDWGRTARETLDFYRTVGGA